MTDTDPRQAYYDRRNKETETKISDAVRRILAADGFEKLTIEEVARVSKVAKTTIYRRADNATDLGIQALGVETDKLKEMITDLLETADLMAGSLPDVGIGNDATIEVLFVACLQHLSDERKDG